MGPIRASRIFRQHHLSLRARRAVPEGGKFGGGLVAPSWGPAWGLAAPSVSAGRGAWISRAGCMPCAGDIAADFCTAAGQVPAFAWALRRSVRRPRFDLPLFMRAPRRRAREVATKGAGHEDEKS